MRRQHGVISRAQAFELGLTRHQIAQRVGSGRWVRLTSGVYASSAAPATWGRQLTAALLDHPRAVAGGRSAAFLLGIPGFGPGRPQILVPYGGSNRSPIARVIRARHFDDVETVHIDGFTATSASETILTLSMWLSPSLVERMIDDQMAAKKVAIQDFHPILDRLAFARQPGLPTLRRLLKERSPIGYQPPSSALERLLYNLLEEAPIPTYQRQVTLNLNGTSARVDALIPEWHLIVEADGRRWHNRQADHDRDRARDAAALAAGYRVLRLTWQMLRYEEDECMRRLLAVGRA